MSENENYYLVEVRSEVPKEIEVSASSPKEAREEARRKLDLLRLQISTGRVTESGKHKGWVWNPYHTELEAEVWDVKKP